MAYKKTPSANFDYKSLLEKQIWSRHPISLAQTVTKAKHMFLGEKV